MSAARWCRDRRRNLRWIGARDNWLRRKRRWKTFEKVLQWNWQFFERRMQLLWRWADRLSMKMSDVKYGTSRGGAAVNFLRFPALFSVTLFCVLLGVPSCSLRGLWLIRFLSLSLAAFFHSLASPSTHFPRPVDLYGLHWLSISFLPLLYIHFLHIWCRAAPSNPPVGHPLPLKLKCFHSIRSTCRPLSKMPTVTQVILSGSARQVAKKELFSFFFYQKIFEFMGFACRLFSSAIFTNLFKFFKFEFEGAIERYPWQRDRLT